MRNQWMIGAAGAVALLATSAGAYAAPASNAASLLASSQESSAVEKVDYRRCWWRNGKRRCGWVREGSRVRGYGYGGGYGYSYGKARPEDLPTGSTEWWRAMDEEGRGGFGDRP